MTRRARRSSAISASSSRRSASSSPRASACGPRISTACSRSVKGEPAEALVNEVVLRAQSQAEYTHENYGHFGLNLRRYAHFTSPIRRYADLIVHRALIRALSLGAGGLEDSGAAELADIAERISAAERRAMAAERETMDRLIAAHHGRHIGAQFRRPHRRRHARRPVRAPRATPAPTASFPPPRSAPTISASTKRAARSSEPAPARLSASATASMCAWSRRRPSPARCGSRCCRKAPRAARGKRERRR